MVDWKNPTLQSFANIGRSSIRTVAILLLSVFLCQCSNPSALMTNNSPSPTPLVKSYSMETLNTVDYNFLNINYPMKLMKISHPDFVSPVYVQHISACSDKCPLVIISNPYSGIDWADDGKDAVWLQRANANLGYQWVDESGPNYVVGATRGKVSFKNETPNDAAASGALYLPNKISLLIVYNRFYLGRSLKDYVQDYVLAASAASLLDHVDPQNIAFFGASLGGFVALNSAIESSLNPKALVLVSPLSDLKKQHDFVLSVGTLVNSNSTLLDQYLDFFDPYLRRIYAFTGGTPADFSSAYEAYKPSGSASKLKTPTIVFHDEWDTLVPFDETLGWVNARPDLIEPVLYQHSSGINWNTFVLDHQQPTEGQNNENLWPWYHLFLLNKFFTTGQGKTLYYDYNQWVLSMAKFKEAQARGQNISWLRNRMLDLCLDQLMLLDVTNVMTPVSGKYFVTQIMKNIWGFDRPETTICEDLKTYSF